MGSHLAGRLSLYSANIHLNSTPALSHALDYLLDTTVLRYYGQTISLLMDIFSYPGGGVKGILNNVKKRKIGKEGHP